MTARVEEGSPGHGSRRRRRATRLLVAAATVVVTLVGIELVFRLREDREMARGIRDVRQMAFEGQVAGFRAWPHVLFERRPEVGPRARINSFGFNDRPWHVEREPGALRILCLGGSTTEGGNSGGHEGSYPRQLEHLLAAATERPVEVMNAGMSGWTTAETLVSYFLLLQDFRPDLVILHHAVNDTAPRNSLDFQPDYSHYRKPFTVPRLGWLERKLIAWSDAYTWCSPWRRSPPTLGDVCTIANPERKAWKGESLPPATRSSFVRNVQTIAAHVESQGGRAMLVTLPLGPRQQAQEGDKQRLYTWGTLDHDQALRDLAAEHGYLLCDLQRIVEADPEAWADEFLDHVHVTPAGNAAKAREIAAVLIDRWLPTLH